MNNKPLLGSTTSRRLEEKDIHLTLKRKKKNLSLISRQSIMSASVHQPVLCGCIEA